MSTMPSPPEGYNAIFKGFNNLPEARGGANIPGALNQPKLTIADAVPDHSNTTRIPFGGPVVPKGN